MKCFKKITFYIRLLISVVLIFCIASSYGVFGVCAYSDIGVLGVPKVQQSKTNWCWAACGESILKHYDIYVSQATFAAEVLDTLPAPNSTASDSQVLSGLNYWGVTGTLVANSISFSTISSNIRAGRPIYAGWSWRSGGGHAIVINGFNGTSASNGYVEYMDPGYGNYYVLSYNNFKGGSSYDRTWDGTIYAMYAT